MKPVQLIFILFALVSCSPKQEPVSEVNINEENQVPDVQKIDTIPVEWKLDLDSLDLVDVSKMNENIFFDLKYAGKDNFMKQVLYKRINRPYLQKEIAERLSKCQDYLTKKDSSLHLLIYDAVRPVSVQQQMWNALDTIPVAERGKFVSNPKNRSLHNYGAAVDITICTTHRKVLDMGAKYDEVGTIAYPSYEQFYLEKGMLTPNQIENRKLLREVMRSQGFSNIPSEWWHFNGLTRNQAKQKFLPLLEEPNYLIK